VAKRARASKRPSSKRPAKRTTKKSPHKVAARKAAKRKTAARAAASRSRSKKPPKPSRLSTVATLARGAAKGAVVAIARRLPWSKRENDPIVLLETDHRRFEDLLKQGEETTEQAVKTRTQLLKTLTAELDVHELIEENILYPALKPFAAARDVVLEGYQEHHVADLIVKELHALRRDDEKWGAKFKVLKENIEHHIEEEEKKMFPTARGLFSTEELNDLGVRMKALKAELEG
jgi:hemerythrin-like domain-containing protein